MTIFLEYDRQGYTGTRGISGGRIESTEISDTSVHPVRTEPYRNVRQGIEAVPNLAEDSGRVISEHIFPVNFGTYPTEHTLGTIERALSTISSKLSQVVFTAAQTPANTPQPPAGVNLLLSGELPPDVPE